METINNKNVLRARAIEKQGPLKILERQPLRSKSLLSLISFFSIIKVQIGAVFRVICKSEIARNAIAATFFGCALVAMRANHHRSPPITIQSPLKSGANHLSITILVYKISGFLFPCQAVFILSGKAVICEVYVEISKYAIQTVNVARRNG